MPILAIKQLVKAYGAHRVLDRLNLEIAAGEIVALMGKSGVGKTTLLSCILGFEKPDSGTIEINGRDVARVAIEERRLAYVSQDYGLFPHLSVRDNIAFGMTIRKKPHTEIDQRVQELLHTVELPKIILNRGVDRLSGGERQRVALARALAVEPKLFLF
ncbi:MAG: Spermidine/putrescine ABC transporter ATP-binding subunit, partial [uncultured bacterium]